MNDTNKGTGIVLNRMYVGDYLASNLGHEIINLYQADNGGNYIYLNSSGDFVKAHQGQIGYMLFVKYYGIGEVEVIGMATGLKDVYCTDQQFTGKYKGVNKVIFDQQQQYVSAEGGITYGGVSIFNIFGKAGQQSVFITYKAAKVYVPKEGKRLFIRFHVADASKYPVHESSDIVVALDGYQQAHDHSQSMILTLRFPLVISQQPLASHGRLSSTTATAHAKGLWLQLTSDTNPPCNFHSSAHVSPTTDFSGLPTGLAPEFHTWPLGLGVFPTHNSNTDKCL